MISNTEWEDSKVIENRSIVYPNVYKQANKKETQEGGDMGIYVHV